MAAGIFTFRLRFMLALGRSIPGFQENKLRYVVDTGAQAHLHRHMQGIARHLPTPCLGPLVSALQVFAQIKSHEFTALARAVTVASALCYKHKL